MGQKTKIEWCDSTWNPIVGCSKVSAGCANCYALNMAARFSKAGQPFHGTVQTSEHVRLDRYIDGLPQLDRTKPRWTGKIVFKRHKLEEPLHWRKPRRIFVCSMGDLFHSSVTNEQIAAVFGVMAACPQHTFMVLTKRPERMAEWYRIILPSLIPTIAEEYGAQCCLYEMPWPLPNVWLGVSVEDQSNYDKRWGIVNHIPAAKRFVSYEPALGPLRAASRGTPTPDWVIAGAETGPGKRRADLEWFRQLRNQCAAADVPFFLKQDSSGSRELDGRRHEEMP